MAGRNWLDTFGRAKSFDVNVDLDRGYEAALLIQSLELEYYGDRPIRPDLELSVPVQFKPQFCANSELRSTCRSSLDKLEYQRAQFDPQELRQLQLIESVVNRYNPAEPVTRPRSAGRRIHCQGLFLAFLTPASSTEPCSRSNVGRWLPPKEGFDADFIEGAAAVDPRASAGSAGQPHLHHQSCC